MTIQYLGLGAFVGALADIRNDDDMCKSISLHDSTK